MSQGLLSPDSCIVRAMMSLARSSADLYISPVGVLRSSTMNSQPWISAVLNVQERFVDSYMFTVHALPPECFTTLRYLSLSSARRVCGKETTLKGKQLLNYNTNCTLKKIYKSTLKQVLNNYRNTAY